MENAPPDPFGARSSQQQTHLDSSETAMPKPNTLTQLTQVSEPNKKTHEIRFDPQKPIAKEPKIRPNNMYREYAIVDTRNETDHQKKFSNIKQDQPSNRKHTQLNNNQ
ncbi:hypothetical protein PGT21_001230 [Puccinia graminis f. sp. tritici]|uniref:Uncharacterized protein n=1 Tax=Puccinia graminis f. sp. tritici TaxID=56615 RepID=A0A5B0P363_PUCGR|nr:hypothetical protein PGT21_001230 [Puccinia graminis f. sp. tritici]